MIIKIPYNRRELVADGDDYKVEDNRGEITAALDLSVQAEERWEKHFPKQAEKETVFAYVERIGAIKRTSANMASIVLSGIKALYCFLLSEDLPTFEAFASLFDLSDSETLNKQIKVLEAALGAAKNGGAATAKN